MNNLIEILLGIAVAICLWLGWLCSTLRERCRRFPEVEKALKEKEAETASWRAQVEVMEEAKRELSQAFKALSSDALKHNNESFLQLARISLEKFQEGAKGDLEKRQQSIEQTLLPVKETLTKLELGMREIEKERKGQHEALGQQMRSLLDTERQLRTETASLVKALRAPAVRGQWGELQLRRVVELAGMIGHCDFYEQQTLEGQRPDIVVRLPGGRQVVIDAKTPLEAYLDAVQTEDVALRTHKMKEHARQVRAHVSMLSKKAYWEQFQPTPEFVVLFLPAEPFYSAALEHDPSLIEVGAEHRVLIATPTTLIALLRAVAYGWKQESLSRHAEEVRALGQELYKRLSDMTDHWSKMGRGLASAVDAYNKAMGSLDSRVLVTARKLKELGATSDSLELETPPEIDHKVNI